MYDDKRSDETWGSGLVQSWMV